jgi:hypothetical protein
MRTGSRHDTHPPYYRIFRQEAQQKADLFAVQLRLEGWLLEKEELLVSLQAY